MSRRAVLVLALVALATEAAAQADAPVAAVSPTLAAIADSVPKQITEPGFELLRGEFTIRSTLEWQAKAAGEAIVDDPAVRACGEQPIPQSLVKASSTTYFLHVSVALKKRGKNLAVESLHDLEIHTNSSGGRRDLTDEERAYRSAVADCFRAAIDTKPWPKGAKPGSGGTLTMLIKVDEAATRSDLWRTVANCGDEHDTSVDEPASTYKDLQEFEVPGPVLVDRFLSIEGVTREGARKVHSRRGSSNYMGTTHVVRTSCTKDGVRDGVTRYFRLPRQLFASYFWIGDSQVHWGWDDAPAEELLLSMVREEEWREGAFVRAVNWRAEDTGYVARQRTKSHRPKAYYPSVETRWADDVYLTVAEYGETGRLTGVHVARSPEGNADADLLESSEILLVRTYHASGSPHCTEEKAAGPLKDVPIQRTAGRPHGTRLCVAEDGRVLERGRYDAGTRVGAWVEVNEQGELVRERYIDGKPSSSRRFSSLVSDVAGAPELIRSISAETGFAQAFVAMMLVVEANQSGRPVYANELAGFRTVFCPGPWADAAQESGGLDARARTLSSLCEGWVGEYWYDSRVSGQMFRVESAGQCVEAVTSICGK